MINVADFGILMTVKSGCLFFLKGHHGLITQVMGPSTLNFFLLSCSHLITQVAGLTS
jgi:hypothetical protein